MTIVCIQGDKFGYFPPSQPIVVLPPTRDTSVSSGTPVTTRVLALFDFFGGGASPSLNQSKRESGVYISINARDRMVAGLQQETGVSPLWWEKGAV
jgi:hypothetical protein